MTYWSLTVGGDPLSPRISRLVYTFFFFFFPKSTNLFSQSGVKFRISKAPLCQVYICLRTAPGITVFALFDKF